MNTERLVYILRHEASKYGQGDYKHQAAARLEEITAQLAASEQRMKALEDALRAIADGRGMVRDKSTIYMNGRTPEIPAIFNKYDMQEIAKIVLEATCTNTQKGL